MIFRQLFDSVSGTYTYLLGSRPGGEALIIDPVLEKVDRYLKLLAELELTLVKAVDTHVHADHVTGLDDLRRFNWLQSCSLKCYAQQEDITAIRRMFAYAFADDPDYPSHKPDLDFIPIDGPIELTRSRRLQPARSPAEVQSTDSSDPAATCTVLPIPLIHGPTPVLGFRFANFAYCTDCNHIPEGSMELLTDLEVLILDALRCSPHPAHFNLDEAVAMARRIGAKRTYFTHMTHEIRHAQLDAELPDRMALSYDGLILH